MCCGVLNDDLVVRVGPERYEKALSHLHTRPMDFTGRPLKGFVFVSPGGYKTDKALAKIILSSQCATLRQPVSSMCVYSEWRS